LNQTIAVVICYFLIMIAIGAASSKNAAGLDEFHLAGRRVKYIMLTATLCATIVGASATMGMAGLGFKEGLTGAWWMLSGTIGLLALSVLFAQKIRDTGCYTLPELIGTFYGERVRTAASALIIISWVGLISGQIIPSGKVLSAIFGGSEQLFMAASALVFILYTVQGGQHSIVRTDLVQFIIIMAGIMLLLFRTLDATGLAFLKAQSFPVSPERNAFGVLSMIVVVGSTYLVGPDIYSRIFLAKDPQTARGSAIIAALILVPLAFAISARVLFPGIQAEQALPVLMMSMLSPFERGIVGSALLAAFMSSAATPLMTATTTMALDLYRKAKPLSEIPELMITSKMGALIIGMAALGLAMISPGIIAVVFSVYTIFTGGMLVPAVAGFYKEKLGLTPKGALAALVGGGLTAIILGKSYPLLGMAVSVVLLFSVSWLERRQHKVRRTELRLELSNKES
jgi:SSS family solute:Na+ symporter